MQLRHLIIVEYMQTRIIIMYVSTITQLLQDPKKF